eukprot:442994_1
MSTTLINFLANYLFLTVDLCSSHDNPVQMCVSGSKYSWLDGTYEWIYWDSTLNGSVYFQQSYSKYLYPYTWSANTYRWMIGGTAGSNSQFSAYATHYNPPPFEIEDTFKNWICWDNVDKQFEPQHNMTASDCTNVCISGSDHKFLNGIYIWSHFSQTYNSSVYFCSQCNANEGIYLFGYNWKDNGSTSYNDYGWRIGSNASSPYAWSACNVGNNNGPNFIFTLDLCIDSWYSWNDTKDEWEWDSNMIVDNCPHTHSPTNVPTNTPSQGPSDIPTSSPTFATESPSKRPIKPPTTANPTPAPTDCVLNINEELDTTTLNSWTVNSTSGTFASTSFVVINDSSNCYATNPCINIIGDGTGVRDMYIEKTLDSSGWNDLTINVEVKTVSLDANSNEYGFVELICGADTPQRTEFNHDANSKHYSGCVYTDTTQCDTIKLRVGGYISGTKDYIYVTQILLQYSTSSPSLDPTQSPTNIPSTTPTNIPSMNPTHLPSIEPSVNPTQFPTTTSPTNIPSTYIPTKVGDGRVEIDTTNLIVTAIDIEGEIGQNNQIMPLVLYIVVGVWLLILLIIGIFCYRRGRQKRGYIQDTNIEKNKMNVNKLQAGFKKRNTVMSVSRDMSDMQTPTGYGTGNNILSVKSVEMNDLSNSNVLNSEYIDNGDVVTAGNDEGETNRNSENDSETPMGDDNIPADDFIVHSNDEETLQ